MIWDPNYILGSRVKSRSFFDLLQTRILFLNFDRILNLRISTCNERLPFQEGLMTFQLKMMRIFRLPHLQCRVSSLQKMRNALW